MKERQEHLGWQMFRIVSISINAPFTAGSDDRNDAYCFIGKIYPKETEESIDYSHPRIKDRADRTVKAPLTFNADVVIEGDGPIDLHLRIDEHNWDEVMGRTKYIRGSGVDTLVFGYKVLPGEIEAKGI